MVGLQDATVTIIGEDAAVEGALNVSVGPDQTRELRVLVTSLDNPQLKEPVVLYFEIEDQEIGRTAVGRDFFRTPSTAH